MIFTHVVYTVTFRYHICKVRVDKLTTVGVVEVTSLVTLGVVAEIMA